MSIELELRDIARHYGSTVAVAGVSLQVSKGELVALLGPSGCGKTTTLRIVAGFVKPTHGSVYLSGREITSLSPHERDTGMVFQSYALFPHLSASENIAFGLKRRGVPKTEIVTRVERMLALLKLEGLGARMPSELSGGQQQRVAVGRALVINPAVVLLDEPFSNLDAQLREGTRIELRRIQQELGLTVLFVTHDQAEAMSISDRVAIMNHGRIEQLDSPRNVYTRPATRFIASFVGKANILEGRLVSRSAEGAFYDCAGLPLLAREPGDGSDGALVLRPELIRIQRKGSPLAAVNMVTGVVRGVSYSGPVAQLEVAVLGDRILNVEGSGSLPLDFPPGSNVTLDWKADDVVVCTR